MAGDPEAEYAEGWYTDPFGRHEARWMSDGNPTRLVRDGAIESYDEPPDEEPSHRFERIEVLEGTEGPQQGRDLLRAGNPDSRSLHARMEEAGEFGGAAGSRVAVPSMGDEEEREEEERDVGIPERAQE